MGASSPPRQERLKHSHGIRLAASRAILPAPCYTRPARANEPSRRGNSIDLAFPTVRTIEIGTEPTSLGEVEIEQVANFRFIAGLSLGVVQRGHPVTLRIGRWSIQGNVAGSVVPAATARHRTCLFLLPADVKELSVLLYATANVPAHPTL